MIRKIKELLKNYLLNFLNIESNDTYLEKLKDRGLTVGENFNMQKDVILDDTHCWLITIGDNVTLAPRVHVLCHDASTKNHINYTKIGKVTIGNNVFVGANSTIMPTVTIGNNAIVGAHSLVTKDVPDGEIFVGVPAKKIGLVNDFINQNKKDFNSCPLFDESYTMRYNVSNSMKEEMKLKLEDSPNRKGYII